MKKKFLLLLVLSAFVACKSNIKHSDIDSALNKTTSKDQSSRLIQKFKPFIQGVWVKSDYIEKVTRTKSPMAAEDLATGLTTMYIETGSIKGDSIDVKGGWGNHEGAELALKFKAGKTSGTILLGDFDLGYSVKNGDTAIILFGYDKDKKEHTTTRYAKALNKQSDLGDGLNYLINKGLIAGKYTVTDSLGKSSNIIFTKEGKVNGFGSFATYYVQNDLGGEPMNNLDEIGFDLFNKHSTPISYTFKINKDTLSLYDTKANGDSSELVVDKLRYKLVRQK